jgi:hypothetical protein
MSVSTLASFEYLERLPGTTFRRLYQQPSTALAIFRRMLPHLGMTLSLVAGIVLTSNSKDFCHGITIYEQANAPARP